MEDILELLYEDCDLVSKKLQRMTEKFRQHGDIPNSEVDLFDKLTHSLKSIKTTIAMIESEQDQGYSGYHGPYYSQNNSYRGNSYRNRNSMGRYSRTDGLEEMLSGLSDEKRMKVQRYIEDMNRL